MKEIREILNAMDRLEEPGSAVLATVVHVNGSSFRLPGAKMLILEDGMTVGTVSGGCIEADVLERAAAVRESGKPELLIYDTTKEQDSVFSLNMGCRGVVSILLESAVDCPVLKFLKGNIENSRDGVIATQVAGDNVGAQVIVDSAGLRHNSFADPEVSQGILAAADLQMKKRQSRYLIAGESQFYVEYVPVPTRLVIFGAGSDAIPLANIAFELGWKTHIVDHRPAYANGKRFPKADMISTTSRERLFEAARIGADTVAVVMSHNYELDKQVLGSVLGTEIRYIGVMGPKTRTGQMLEELSGEGIEITDEMRARIHGPVGLDIGAFTPEGIALSISAEIQTVLGGRNGGYLKDRDGSIYGRE